MKREKIFNQKIAGVKSTAVCGLMLSLLTPFASQAWEGQWLLGVSAALSDRDGNMGASIFHPAPGLQITTISQDNASSYDSGYLFGFLAGYELTQKSWILGLELNLEWYDRHNEGNDNVWAFTDAVGHGWNFAPHLSTNTMLGLSARVGYEFCRYLVPYVRAGWEYNDDNHLTYSAFSPIPDSDDIGNYVQGNDVRNTNQWFLGAGLQFPLDCLMMGLSARLEYDYHFKGDSLSTTDFTRDDVTIWQVSSNVHTQELKASIVWNLPIL